MNLRPIYVSIISALMLTVTYGCSDGSVPVSMSPEQVVQDFYQSINDRDCERHVNLRSSNDPLTGGKSHADAVKACQQQIPQGAPTTNVKDVSLISNDGNKAEVKYKSNFIYVNGDISPTFDCIDTLIVENGYWKVDAVHCDGENSAKTRDM